MIRKFGWSRVHPFGFNYGKFLCGASVRRAIGVAIVAVGWTYFLTYWLNSAAPNPAESGSLIQQMIWNPSPK